MKLKVLSVKENNNNQRASFSAIDENGRVWPCIPGQRVLQEYPSFPVEPEDELVVDDFVPDLITGQIAPVLIPQLVRKPGRSN